MAGALVCILSTGMRHVYSLPAWMRFCINSISGGRKLVDLRPALGIDHVIEKTFYHFAVLLGAVFQRACDASRLGKGKRKRELTAAFRGIEFAVAAIMLAGSLHHMASVDQLLEHARKALFGDAQHFQKLGHRHARLAIDKIEDTVMRPPETDLFKDKVRIGSEIAIGKKQKLNDVEIGRLLSRQWIGYIIHIAGRIHIGAPFCCAKYVSIIDVIQSPR